MKEEASKLTDRYKRVEIVSDRNCLFRAIQYCLTGSQEGHENLRKETCEYIERREHEYKYLFERDSGIDTFQDYIYALKEQGT